jgi:hypothetical protein
MEDPLLQKFSLLESELALLTGVVQSMADGMTFFEGSDFHLLAACSLSKQLEHAIGVLLTIQHADSALIARSMLEGMWQIEWTAEDVTSRAFRWRKFIYVAQWRELMDSDARKAPVDPATRAKTMEGFRTHKRLFERRNDQRSFTSIGTSYRDKYYRTWHGLGVKDLAEALGDLPLYYKWYERFSQRHHWDIAEMVRSVDNSVKPVVFSGATLHALGGAADVAYACLFRTASCANHTLRLGFNQALTERRDAYNRLGLNGDPSLRINDVRSDLA